MYESKHIIQPIVVLQNIMLEIIMNMWYNLLIHLCINNWGYIKMKKITAAVIAIIMSACMLSSCTGGAAETADTGAAETTTISEEKGSETKKEKEKTKKEETTAETEEEKSETEAKKTKKAEETTAETTSAETTAPETTSAETSASEKASAVKAEDSRLAKLGQIIEKSMNSNKYAYRLSIEEDGAVSDMIIYSIDGSYRMDVVGESDGQKVNMTIIINDGKTYMLDNSQKLGYYTTGTNTSDLNAEVDEIMATSGDDQTPLSVEKVTFEGKEYICETYKKDGTETKCYFTEGDDNSVLIISGKSRLEMECMATPSASVFDIPSDYNVTEM